MLNVALSGDLEGGLCSGFTAIAGQSKHFKTSFALIMAGAYLREHPDSALLFYDTEFGSPEDYFELYGVDPERVLHVPIKNIEELKFDLVNQLDNLSDEDKVIIIVDSFGNIASKKEVEDALDQKSVADMTRAKALKGLFRMVTPYLKMKDIPMLGIAHTYKEIGLFPKDIVGGGTGIYYSADNIWIIGRRQVKTGSEVTGYDFVVRAEKSRFIKEGSKIPITVTWEGGVDKYSGLLEVAIAGGFVEQSGAWYDNKLGSKVNGKGNIDGETFFEPILKNEDFKKFIVSTYKLRHVSDLDTNNEFVMEGEE